MTRKSIFRKTRRYIVWMAPCWPISYAPIHGQARYLERCHLRGKDHKGRGWNCKTCDGKRVKIEEVIVTTWRRVKR